MNECTRNESFTDGNVGAGGRVMVTGGCLPVKGSERMTWKYDASKYRCGLVETKKYVLFECTLYREEIERRRVAVRHLKDGTEGYEIINGKRVKQ